MAIPRVVLVASVARFTFGKGIETIGGCPMEIGHVLRSRAFAPLLKSACATTHGLENMAVYTSRHSLARTTRGHACFYALLVHWLLAAGLGRSITLMSLVGACSFRQRERIRVGTPPIVTAEKVNTRENQGKAPSSGR
ncbi:hypothetical protein BKA67DRAFT_254911 [Truncatella angustata]|uniref:Uncharacterized protein n=1 Tax=Truncatella angustata TaxID=152316 RepID=A0A9P8UPY1_9PEZI|nr:uncharacterized protein BKA67DRAFT_254911 [Truncatella angustata]KAH6656082.1 hypothetical protein BKA67DRAFT_254911 [Truncatella angustata]